MEDSRTFPEDSSFSLTKMFLFLQKKRVLFENFNISTKYHTYIHTYIQHTCQSCQGTTVVASWVHEAILPTFQ